MGNLPNALARQSALIAGRRARSSAAERDAAEDRLAARHSRTRAESEPVTLELRVHIRTNRATLVSADDDEADQVWLPNSMLDAMPVCDGGVHQITIPLWLATNRGLV